MPLMSLLGGGRGDGKEAEGEVWGWLVQELDFTNLNTVVHPLSDEEHSVGRDTSASIVLREVLCRKVVEEVYKDRDQFANLVRDIAKPDVGKMGIEILSFTIKDVYDNVDYLASLGKSQTAAVKRDAEIGVAQVR